MALCVPKAMILGHSFVKRLKMDLDRRFDKRAKINFDLNDINIRLFGTGGRTTEKICQFDLNNVARFTPDIVILEVSTNDLTRKRPETVGSEIEELTRILLDKCSVSVVGVCQVIPRADEYFNIKAKLLNQYLKGVIDDPRAFTWYHRGLCAPSNDILLEDGVHLSPKGQYALYRSYRGAILKSLRIFNEL